MRAGFLVLGAVASSGAAPAVTMYPSFNQALNVLVPGGTSKGGTIVSLGTFRDTAQCQAACIANADRCWSFVYFPAGRGEEMKIRVAATGLQLQADDEADSFLSTRYQGDDDFSRFRLEPVQGAEQGVSDGASAVRISVVADGRLVGANAKASTADWPQWSVSTKSNDAEDTTKHFMMHTDAKAGTATIQTVGGPAGGDAGYWQVQGGKGGFVFANATAATATAFKVSIASGGGSTSGECFAVLSPGWNPSYDPSAVSGVVQWGCRTDDDCSLNGACDAQAGVCACRPAWKGARCEQLNLLEPTRGAGYRGVDGGHNTSSWGGAVLKGKD